MPYPILTLPYPFARRLRQLLTPEELENLQEAAGQEIRHLKPIVQSVYDSSAHFFYSHTRSKVILCLHDHHYRHSSSDPFKPPFLKCDTLHFSVIKKSKLKNTCFTQMHFKTRTLIFRVCKISVNFLKMVTSRMFAIHKISEVRMWERNRIAENVKLPIIFNLFPNINRLYTCHAYDGWLNDLLELNVTDLTLFCIMHSNIDKLFGFNPDELFKFIEKQETNFYILLRYECNASVDKAETRNFIETLLKPRFYTVEKVFSNVHVHIGDAFIGEWIYFAC